MFLRQIKAARGSGKEVYFFWGGGRGWEWGGSLGKGGDKEVRRELLSVILLRVYLKAFKIDPKVSRNYLPKHFKADEFECAEC